MNFLTIIKSHCTSNEVFKWKVQLELWDPGKDWKISSTAISSASCLSRQPVLIVSTVSQRVLKLLKSTLILWQWCRLKLMQVSILESLPEFRATPAPILKLPNIVREVVPHQSNGYLEIRLPPPIKRDLILYLGHTKVQLWKISCFFRDRTILYCKTLHIQSIYIL